MFLSKALLILGIMCMAAAVGLVVRQWRVPAAIPAYAALVLLHFSTYIYLPVRTFVFWGVATLMVAALKWLLPQEELSGERSGNLIIGVSSLAGCLLGILVGARLMTLGVILGTLVGMLAFSRSPQGRWIMASHKTFISFFCAKSLPVIVAVAMVGIGIEGFIF